MNFAIEVTPAANPLTPQTLFHILQSSVSHSQQQLHIGAQQLLAWETEKGFYSLLQVSPVMPANDSTFIVGANADIDDRSGCLH